MRRLVLPHVLATLALLFGCADPQNTPPPAAAAVDTPAPRAAPACDILMGWDPWEPYQYQDVDGNLRGLDIELVKAIFAEADCNIEFVEGRWGTLVQRLQEGDVHMLTGATRTPARESFARFSDTYRDENFQLYVRKDDVEKFASTTIEELMRGDFKLGVTEQYTYGDSVSALQEDPALADKFVGATVGELNYSRLLDFKIDGFLADPFVAARAFRVRDIGDQIAPHPIEIHSGDVNLMFSKVSVEPETVARINDAIRALKADGRYQAIVDKYLN